MRIYTFILFIAVFYTERVFACDVGYYLDDNNECKSCGTNGYYCPGDNQRYACPSVQDFCDAAATEPDLVSIICKIVSWHNGTSSGGNSGRSITDCRARPVIETSCGRYFYSVTYNVASASYPLSNTTQRYWDTVNKGYYLYSTIGTSSYSQCIGCANAPLNAHYTDAGTPDIGNCPWKCDDGFGQTDDFLCHELCHAGITELHVADVVFNLYVERYTNHTLNVYYNNQT